MKNLIWFIVIIILAALAYSIFFDGDSEDILNLSEEETNTNEEDSMAVETPSLEIPEGATLVDTEASSLNWRGNKTLVANYTDRGIVKLQAGYVVFDEEDRPVSGEFVVDMSTIQALSTSKGGDETQNREGLTTHLKTDDWFNAERYPTSTVAIDTIAQISGSENTYNASGNLTIRGITHPISFEVTEVSEGNFTGTAEIDRSIYDVKFGSGSFFTNLGDNLIDDIFHVDFNLVTN